MHLSPCNKCYEIIIACQLTNGYCIDCNLRNSWLEYFNKLDKLVELIISLKDFIHGDNAVKFVLFNFDPDPQNYFQQSYSVNEKLLN